MIGIELKNLRFGFLCCLGVCPKTWQAPCATTHLYSSFCFYTGCLSKDVTGSLFSFFLWFFALTQCVCPRTWQVTVLFTALLYQGPLFIRLLWSLFISLLLFAFTQCLCPKTWQVTVLFTALLYQGPSFNLFAFTQCVCPKTWQVTVLFTAFSGYTVYLSKDVTGALLPTPLTSFPFLFLRTPFPPLFVC